MVGNYSCRLPVIYQEMRHGVSEGVMIEAIGQAAKVKTKPVRRANQLWSDLGEVALAASASAFRPPRYPTVIGPLIRLQVKAKSSKYLYPQQAVGNEPLIR
jgi:ATP-dependent DNA ligase